MTTQDVLDGWRKTEIPKDDFEREAFEIVESALEKQISISREIIEGKYFCPKCHNLMPHPGYCGCGQKLY